jgi:hypothetical protein
MVVLNLHAARTPVGMATHQRHFEYAESKCHALSLWNKCDEQRPVAGSQGRQQFTVHHNLPGVILKGTRYYAQQSRFTAAIWANKAYNLTRSDRKAHIL